MVHRLETSAIVKKTKQKKTINVCKTSTYGFPNKLGALSLKEAERSRVQQGASGAAATHVA